MSVLSRVRFCKPSPHLAPDISRLYVLTSYSSLHTGSGRMSFSCLWSLLLRRFEQDLLVWPRLVGTHFRAAHPRWLCHPLRSLLRCDKFWRMIFWRHHMMTAMYSSLVIFSLTAGEFVTIAWYFFATVTFVLSFLNTQLAGQPNMVAEFCPTGSNHGSVIVAFIGLAFAA